MSKTQDDVIIMQSHQQQTRQVNLLRTAIACSFVIVVPNVNIPRFMAQSITSPLPLTDPQINVEHSKPTTWIKLLPQQSRLRNSRCTICLHRTSTCTDACDERQADTTAHLRHTSTPTTACVVLKHHRWRPPSFHRSAPYAPCPWQMP